jgi:hypothetical protein
MSSGLFLSQELFDETVLENESVFELSPQEALDETLSQYSNYSLLHLVRSHPSTDTKERLERQEFKRAVEMIKSEDNEELLQALTTIRECCTSNPQAHLILLQHYQAMPALVSLFQKNDLSSATKVLQETIETLVVILTPTNNNNKSSRQVQSELRDCMARCWDHWTTLFTSASTTMQSLLLQLAFVSCKFNEENKQQWLRSSTTRATNKNGIVVLMKILQQEEENVLVKIQACRLISTIGKFDDFRTPSTNTSLPTTSCAHEAAMAFYKHDAVPILYTIVHECMNETTTTDNTTALLETSLSALRVLAIQHDIVESMVEVGVLDLIPTILVEYCKSLTILAATLGLIRNMCAHDVVKTQVCRPNGILQTILTAMQRYPQHEQIQQHACASMAQMALRHPHNSRFIVENVHGHVLIIQAMKHHTQNAVIQRQGALAIRNLASRCPKGGAIHHALLNAGAEPVLREAGKHQSSVDEAYAALKELNCSVKVYKVDEQGKTVERTTMFGEAKLNFRPVLEESSWNTMD